MAAGEFPDIPMATPDNEPGALMHVHLPPNSVSVNSAAGENHLDFDAVAAFANNSKNTQPVITTGETYAMALSDAQMASLRNRGVDMKNGLRLGAAQYTVRVVIRDNLTGKVGSVTAPLTRKPNRIIGSAQSQRSFESAGLFDHFAVPASS
jgi:hypothetical protein